MTPKISIIIPCYNSEKYISETLDSVINQTFLDIEIIIVDDGSTDSTRDILETYGLKDSRIQVITQENQYYIQARINGVKIARGEYLLFLDSDDIISPTYLEKCSNILDNNPEISIVYSKARFFDKINESWNLPKFNLNDFLFRNCIYVSALLRKEEYLRAGGFDPKLKMKEDWDLFLSIIEKGGQVYQLPEELFFYRKRQDETSITDNWIEERISDNEFIIYHKHYDFYKRNGIYFSDLLRLKRKDIEKYNNPIRKIYYKIFKPNKYNKLYKTP